MAKKKNVKTTQSNYYGYRITRKIREDHSDQVKLPFSMNVPPAARHQIEQKAILERFRMMRVLKWLLNNDEASEVIDSNDIHLYPIMEANKYSVILEGNLNTEEVFITVRRNQMNVEDREEFDTSFDIVVEGMNEGDELPDEIRISSDKDAFVEVLKYFAEKCSFIPTIVYLDEDCDEDIYWRSIIRKLVLLHLSLQFKVIKMVVEDVLDIDPDHTDALKLKHDQIDAVAEMEYPYSDDVYYFISYNREEDAYKLFRDKNLSPRMDNAYMRSNKQKKSKKNKKK